MYKYYDHKPKANDTEGSNQNSKDIDTLSTLEVLKVINNEDKTVAFAVEKALQDIEKATDETIKSFANKGRLIYIGASTSGRLGILNASEYSPTYGTKNNKFYIFQFLKNSIIFIAI